MILERTGGVASSLITISVLILHNSDSNDELEGR